MPVVAKVEKSRDETTAEVEYVDRGLHSFQDISHICEFSCFFLSLTLLPFKDRPVVASFVR